MTAPALAIVQDPCPVCEGRPYTQFLVVPWGFHEPALANCPRCLPTEGSAGVWRRVLAPYLGGDAA